MRSNSHLGTLCAGIAFTTFGATVLAPRVAAAQDVYTQVEGGVNVFVSPAQTNLYGLGFYGSARVGLWFTDYLGMHLQAGYANWSASSTANIGPGTLTTLGAGIRIAPELSRSLGRIFLDVDGSYSASGAAGTPRAALDIGLGWLIPIADPIAIGPVIRYNEVFATDGDIGEARFITAGVAIAFPGRRAIPPPPPPPQPPPPDTDGDGVIDSLDLCPNLPAGPHPDPARTGCPIGDRDHDGVLDDIDQCPDTPAGDPNRPGCPLPVVPTTPCVTAPAPTPTPVPTTVVIPTGPATIENGHIRINDSIYFDTASPNIQPRSFPILDAVVAIMAAHPEVEIVRIEGHTDSNGSAHRNLRLSRDRAYSVLSYLSQHGIAETRLQAAGFGSTRPIAEGDSDEAAARNRRVEFVVVRGPGAAETIAPEPQDDEHHHHHGGHGGHHHHH